MQRKCMMQVSSRMNEVSKTVCYDKTGFIDYSGFYGAFQFPLDSLGSGLSGLFLPINKLLMPTLESRFFPVVHISSLFHQHSRPTTYHHGETIFFYRSDTLLLDYQRTFFFSRGGPPRWLC